MKPDVAIKLPHKAFWGDEFSFSFDFYCYRYNLRKGYGTFGADLSVAYHIIAVFADKSYAMEDVAAVFSYEKHDVAFFRRCFSFFEINIISAACKKRKHTAA